MTALRAANAGSIRPEDDAAILEAAESSETVETTSGSVHVNGKGEIIEDETSAEAFDVDANEGEGIKPLPDQVIRELTLGLRLALSENPDMALTALTHALVAQTFYASHKRLGASSLEIRVTCSSLAPHAPGVDDNKGAIQLAEQYTNWEGQMPERVSALWAFVSCLDPDSRLALLAHCVSSSFMAVVSPWDRRPVALAQADDLAYVLSPDMSAIWQPTAQSYFSRVTKVHILAAVREDVGDEAANRIVKLKKQAMAEAAEQLLAGTGWLPELLRTRQAGHCAEPQVAHTQDIAKAQETADIAAE